MQKKQKKIKHILEYSLLQIFLLLIKISPIFSIKLYKKVFYLLMQALLRRHSKVVDKNLEIAFPFLIREQKDQLKRDIFRHYTSVVIDIFFLAVKKKPDKIFPRIQINQLGNLTKALNKKKGVILFSAHFGNWELLPLVLHQQMQMKIYSIARKMDNPLIENTVKKFREYMGSHILYKKGSIRKTLTLLPSNQILYYLIDQNVVSREAVFVNFFGKKASTLNSIARLHIKKNVTVVPAFLHYDKDKIVLNIGKEINHVPSNNLDADVLSLTQTYTSIIENKIKEHPEQWFWFHNRWKVRPKGESNEK